MPTNKKTRRGKSRLKNHAQAQPEPEPTSNNNTGIIATTPEPKGGKNRFLEMFMDPNKITAKRLAIAVPDLPERIKIAELEHRGEEVNVQVVKELFSEIFAEAGISSTSYDEHLFACAKFAAPGSSPEAVELQIRLLASLQINCCLTESFQSSSEIMAAKIQEHMLVFIGENHEEITETCFQQEHSAFAHHYKHIAETSVDELKEEVKKSRTHLLHFSNILGKVRQAVEDIAEELYVSSYACWQCEKPSEFHCTSCQAARYCSKECQLQDWTSFHKPMCKDIKQVHLLFTEGSHAVDQAFADPEGHIQMYGVKPSWRDYEILVGVGSWNDIAIATVQAQVAAAKLPKGPSMLFFYKNLKHVLLGKLWMTPPTNSRITPTQPTPESLEDEDILQIFWRISEVLMYDYTGDNGELHVRLFYKKLKERCDFKPEWPAYNDMIVSMSPEVWLYIYMVATKEYTHEELQRSKTNAKRRMFWRFPLPFASRSMTVCCRDQRKLERRLQAQER